jgi:exopolyphosphatase/guanosine-5'-triphosphate,3'-diphosphate pyrophosphatase
MGSRWEWRTFGRSFGAAEAAIAALPLDPVKDSEELYLLGQDGDTVKVRDALMDVKTLQDVDAAGLQRWEPTMKLPFPLAADDVRRVLASLRVEPASLARAQYTLDELLQEVIGTTAAVRPVIVHKRRRRTTVGGCAAEVSEVEVEGRTTRTIAVEDEDAAKVVAGVRSLGLQDYANTSYPRGLRALLGDEPPRYAVIDVGTNSVKGHVGELASDGQWRSVLDRAIVTRLGEGLAPGGDLNPVAIHRTVEAIGALADEARALGAVATTVVGTAGLRMAANSADVVRAIADRTGHELEVISGEEEGRLAYVATKARLGLDDAGAVVVFDTGGGSTQFTFGHGDRVDRRFSLPIGAVRTTERFGLDRAVDRSVVEAACQFLAEGFASLADGPRPDALVGMGGANTNLAAMDHGLAVYDPEIVCRTVLTRAGIDARIEQLRALDAEGRRAIVGLQPARAEVILAGVCIVRTVMDQLGHDTLTVSDRGLRHGLLVERFGTTTVGGTP